MKMKEGEIKIRWKNEEQKKREKKEVEEWIKKESEMPNKMILVRKLQKEADIAKECPNKKKN